MKKVVGFRNYGFHALNESAGGRYESRTDAVNALRAEMLSRGNTSFRDDKMNLIKDGKCVAGDINRAFNRIVTKNG